MVVKADRKIKGGKEGVQSRQDSLDLNLTFPWEHYSPFTIRLSPYSRRQVIEKIE